MTIFLEILAAILNSLWQTAIVAALVWLALKFIRTNAATRYVIWWSALAVVLVLPAVPRISASLRTQSQPPRPATVQPVSPRGSARIETLDSPAFIIVREERAAKWPLGIAILSLWGAVFLYRVVQIIRSYFYLRGVNTESYGLPVAIAVCAQNSTAVLFEK